MKKTFLFILFMVITTHAQTDKITGSWLMTKAKKDGETKSVYFVLKFTDNNTMEAMDMEIGSWRYDESKNAIVMNSQMDEDFNGQAKILKLTESELELGKSGWEYYYTKLNTDKVSKDNEQSGLAGMWQMDSNNKEIKKILKFELPDNFQFVELTDGSTETISGNWFFFPENKSLVISSMRQPLRGESMVVEFTGNKLTLKHGAEIFNATRVERDDNLERLTFTEEELPEENDVSSSLPWNDFYSMVSYLSDIKNIVYRFGTLNVGIGKIHYVTLVSKIRTNKEKPSVDFVNLRVTETDSMQYSENYKDELSEGFNLFFPETELFPVRLNGMKTITVPAGTFNCTVVEGFDGFDKVRYYMINDKPGIFAKIIKEKIDPFGELEYSIKELVKINRVN